MNIYVSGSLAFDRIMDFPERFSDHILPDKIHVLNVCFLVTSLREHFGGTAGNIACNLAMLGEKPLILAAGGHDFAAYGRWLESLGLPLDGIRTVEDEFTAGAYITTDVADNQITGFNPGAMKYPSLYQFDGLDPSDSLAIVAPGNQEDMENYAAAYKRLGVPYIFDPGQQIPALSAQALADMVTGAAVVISNDYELEMIMRATGFELPELLDKTDTLITTLGDKGSVVRTPGREEIVPAVAVEEVRDPTGAGDSYRAGLIKGMVMGKSMGDCARMGSVSASFSVQCQGTQCHRFTWDEFWERYHRAFESQAV